MTGKFCRHLVGICLLIVVGMPTISAQAENTPFLGEMIWVPYNFAPLGWAFCDGSLLPISQNTALFSLLGTQYGGNGTTNFALPDMRGRVMINAGQLQGGAIYNQGQTFGETTHTLTLNEMPAHNHPFKASPAAGTLTSPANTMYAQSGSMKLYGTNPAVTMSPFALSSTGSSGQPHNNMMPYGTLNCIIAVTGIFPARN